MARTWGARPGDGEICLDRANRDQRGGKPIGRLLGILALVLCGAYSVLQLGALGHPLFWQDEGETVMFGQRVLEYGYPKVHSGGNVVYGMGVPLEFAVNAKLDAYTGSLWGQYYLAAIGVRAGQGVDDLHARTAWVRLPFALLGMGGLALLFLSLGPVFAERVLGKTAAAAGFGGLLCLSTSLVLHLREVRYYAPALALLAAIVWLQFRRPPGRGKGGFGRALLMGSALLLLFNFFHPAALAAGIWIGIEWVLWARGSSGSLRAQLSQARSLWISLVVCGILALGIGVAFGIPTLSRIFSERWDFGPSLYGANLVSLVGYLLRYEFLGPLLLAEAALLWMRWRWGAVPEDARLLHARGSLWRLSIIYALVGAGNPVFFERYFVPLGPLLVLLVLLDLENLWRGIARTRVSSPSLAPVRAFAGICVVVLAGLLWLRADELKGRVEEIRHPVEGPVDVAIEFIRDRYDDPSTLLIATNYEAEPYMYYLGSRVVGRFHAGTPEADAAEAALEPDLVIPRSAQPRSLQGVRRYLLARGFERHELAVADVAYNNIPELAAGRLLSTTHRFRTPRPGRDGPPLAIYTRREAR